MREFEETSYLNVANAPFIAEVYEKYLDNPQDVDESWQRFFESLQDSADTLARDFGGLPWAKRRVKIVDLTQKEAPKKIGQSPSNSPSEGYTPQAIQDTIQAIKLIEMYRMRGHFLAQLDPLGLIKPKIHPELDPIHYGFSSQDMDREIFIGGAIPGLQKASLAKIIDTLQKTYARSIGVEYTHIDDHEIKSWLEHRIETMENRTEFSELGQQIILQRLIEAEEFEKFLHTKYVGTKRFGADGGEAMVPALEQILMKSSELGVKEAVIGMAHRGRLNVICNILKKPYYKILAEFEGNYADYGEINSSGDVKYHLGTSNERDFGYGEVHISLTANPSHLEAVNPVVLGKVRAKQDQRKDIGRSHVMGILIHGDAAFAGQGIVSECFLMSELRGYKTGGTIHFVINNQIGFTTNPEDGRSSDYCSDIAKMIKCPIFHVNGDDAEAVVHVARIAAEYRAKFQKDVVVDMVCYRRFGHNEGDEPAFTQPLMYKAVKGQTSSATKYAEDLAARNIVSKEMSERMRQDVRDLLNGELEKAKKKRKENPDWLAGAWSGLEQFSEEGKKPDTGVAVSVLKQIGECLTKLPDNFAINSKIARQLEAKADMFKTGTGIDWATAEALAFGTLLLEGHPVRLSGQDVERGTFSQRHAVFVDQNTAQKYVSLQHLEGRQGEFEIRNSPLSEYGVLGFEYGYSQADPNALVMWEAQFGDFVNGAQIIIDQFISSAETKWLRMSGLTLLLPHAFEGQGPEHSSARLERFLQLCAENNMRVANCSTPANYFHILRRQLKRKYRKPLILVTPKSLLRHKLCVSDLKDMGKGTRFTRIYDETDKLATGDKIKRVVLCSGKVYYDLLEARREKKIKNVAILRLEQYYPFPDFRLAELMPQYPKAELVWCQEEPKNMGAWNFLDRRLEDVLIQIKHKGPQRPRYVGRLESASPATGHATRHTKEQKQLVEEALEV